MLSRFCLWSKNMLFFLCKWFVKEMQDDYFSSWYNKYYCWSLMFLHGGKPALSEQGMSLHTALQLSSGNCMGLLLIWNNGTHYNLHGIHCVKAPYNKLCLHPHLLLEVFLPQCHLEIFLRLSVHVLCLTWAQVKDTYHLSFSFLKCKSEYQI